MSVDTELRDALTRIADQVVGQGHETRVEVAELRGELKAALATLTGDMRVAATERAQLAVRITNTESGVQRVDQRVDLMDQRVDLIDGRTLVDRAKLVGFGLGIAFAGGGAGAMFARLLGP